MSTHQAQEATVHSANRILLFPQIEKMLIEVEKENTFSQSGTVIEKLLPFDVIITREMGDGLRQKLMNRGVFVYQVDDPDMTPDAIVEQFIQANQQS